MSEPIYDVDYFIAKFSAIPEDKWCVRSWYQNGCRCAEGHSGRAPENNFAMTDEADALNRVLSDALPSGGPWSPAKDINDAFAGVAKIYPQSTPRARILAALGDIKSKQQEAA